MKTGWFKLLSALTVVVVLTCVGCGTTTAPEDAQTPEASTEEFKNEDPSLKGEKPDDVNPPEEKPAEKP